MNKENILRIAVLLIICSGISGIVFLGRSAIKESVVIGFEQGRLYERDILQNAAIAARVASFSVDKTTGKVSFEYHKPVEPEIFQQKAIAAKVAEFRINSETGQSSFVFVPGKVELPVLPMPKKESGGISVHVPLPPKE